MESEIFPYQLEGAAWLKSKRHGLLADEMGLGKTLQTILACDDLNLERVLVICPAVARINWLKEFKRWGRKPRDFALLLRFDDIPLHSENVICSFEYATQFPERLQGPWDVIILDETHFLKSIEAKRSKKILGRLGLVHKAIRVWALSGTPAPNHAGELWPLLFTFGVSNLSYSAFVDRYCTSRMTGYGLQIFGTKRTAIPELKHILSKVMLRRKKSEVLKDLPSIMFSDIVVEPGHVDLTSLTAEIGGSLFSNFIGPKELEDRLKKEGGILTGFFDGTNLDGNQIRTLEALSNSVSTLRRYTGLQKMEPVSDLVRGELAAELYEKVVIFGIHKAVLNGIAQRLKDFNPVLINGDTSPEKRQKYVELFQTDKTTKVFIGNIQAAGTNLTLTAAHNVLFAELDWVPGNNAQAAMRTHRIGQKQNVSVRFVSLDNPMDERVTQVLKRKTNELSEIFETRC